MKNKAREAVAKLRELVDEMHDTLRILEAIDDNDIMEHAWEQVEDSKVYHLFPVDDDPDTLRMEQVQPQDC